MHGAGRGATGVDETQQISGSTTSKLVPLVWLFPKTLA